MHWTCHSLGLRFNSRLVVSLVSVFKARLLPHNNGKVIISGGINISASGIFVETTEENSFQVGELIKLTVKADNLGYPFNVTAQMMRF